MLKNSFFNRDPQIVAKDLLGKILRVKYSSTKDIWLAAMIIETEAYYLEDKASHASLGFTQKRKALFMPAGTIYMYYARGADSLNISCCGEGNAVLIKSGYPHLTQTENDQHILEAMQSLNPPKNNIGTRPIEKLCSGQTLLCKSLGLKVVDWDQQQFCSERFFIEDIHYKPQQIIQTTRLGIPKGRDEHLPYRFIDERFAQHCTQKPKKCYALS